MLIEWHNWQQLSSQSSLLTVNYANPDEQNLESIPDAAAFTGSKS